MPRVGRGHHVGRLHDPLAAAGGNEQAEQRRVERHHDRKSPLRGHAHEEIRERDRDGRLRHEAEDGAVERVLDQDPGRARHRERHRPQERSRAPVEQEPGGEEGEVEVVEVGHREQALLADLLAQVRQHQQGDRHRKERARVELLRRRPRCLPLDRPRLEANADLLRRARPLRRRAGHVGHHHRDDDQDRGHEEALPEEDRLTERDDAGDGQQRGRNRRPRGLEQRGRGGEAESPHAAEAEIGSGADGAVIDPADAQHDLAHEQPGEDQREPPRDERAGHAEERDEGHRRPRRPRDRGQPADQPGEGRRGGDHEAAHDDQGHLHRERHQDPEAAAELGHEPGGALAQGQAGDEHEEHACEREDERIGEIALAEVREERAQPGQGRRSGPGWRRHRAMLPEANVRRPGIGLDETHERLAFLGQLRPRLA